ncbi:hypothetical protein [Streptomyces sp. NPDC059744]|uniref:hypothetical protein n=1 Tax=Streptomyces sp. NPDC059744 TaxID=3346929 RepID=UPI003646C70D
MLKTDVPISALRETDHFEALNELALPGGKMQSGVSASTLISVAIITAVSSLLASAVTAVIAYMLSKRSLAHAADMAALDRSARLNERHRTARRDAYAAYVTALLTSLRDTTMLRNSEDIDTDEAWQKAKVQVRDSYNSMVVAKGVVDMEAPEPLGNRVEELRKLAMEYRQAAEKAVAPGRSKEERQALAKDATEKAVLAFKTLTTFTTEARADLTP